MENLKFGQEIKMALKPKEVKEEVAVEEEVSEYIGQRRVWFIQRDIALTWPSSDENAENVTVFEDYLSLLFDEGWKIEKSQIGVRRAIGDMANEFVIPVLFLLTR
jgi:hypothetical protein